MAMHFSAMKQHSTSASKWYLQPAKVLYDNLVVICTMQETEMGRFQAPEGIAAEEDQLRAEREEKEKETIKVLLLSPCSCLTQCRFDRVTQG